MTTRTLDPVLARQLRRANVSETPPPETWPLLLDQINEHYYRMNDDRALLNRSLELSTNEMEGLRRRAEQERDRLSMVIGLIGQALSDFGALAQDTNTAQINRAKTEFAGRLQAILEDLKIGDDGTTEVSLIRGNLVRLADQLVVLLADTAERAAIKKELEVARAVQQLLVPAADVLEHPRLQIAGMFQPAAECGGDWWTVSELAEGRVLAMIGDVTGHGVASAIITGAAKAACDLAIELTGGRLEASALLAMMNSTLFRTGRRQLMMTCLAMMIDPAAGRLTFASAGHPTPFLIRQGVIHPLHAEGSPLGASLDSPFVQAAVQLEPADVLVGFTDGIVECENHRGEQFTERRLRAISQRAAPGGARKVREAIVEALSAFRSDVPQHDDLTLVVTSFS